MEMEKRAQVYGLKRKYYLNTIWGTKITQLEKKIFRY